jgi:catechol 2,3-dioxygenase-like lactoylglutathione lyase family enzyme
MSITEQSAEPGASSSTDLRTGMRLEVIVLPVSDVDRAMAFYRGLGWRVDAEFTGGPDYRLAQLTPPGSGCSVIFGTGVSSAVPGSVEGLHLAVFDLEQTRAELTSRGVEVSEIFHDAGGVFHHAGTQARVPGPDPEGRSYCSFASFADPDGNTWVLQEIKVRLPGR